MTENEIQVEQETIVGGTTYEAGDNITIEGNVISATVPDVSSFITNTVDNLVNYYTKSETYTQTEINNMLEAITTMNVLVVETLPTEQISTTTIYLVPKQTALQSNSYDEYIYVSSNWEKIGDTQIDLSNYVTSSDLSTALESYTTTTDLTTLLRGKQDTLTAGDNITITNNVISASGGGNSNVKKLDFYIAKISGVNSNCDIKFTLSTESQNILKQDIIEWEKNVSYADKSKGIGLPIYLLTYNGTKYGIDTTMAWQGIMAWAHTGTSGSNDNIAFNVKLFSCEKNAPYNSSIGTAYYSTTYDSTYQSVTINDNSNVGNITYTSKPYGYEYNTSYAATTARSTYLAVNNTQIFTPSGDYNPATKKYVDDKLTSLTGYDATKTQTLKNVNGTLTWVDD